MISTDSDASMFDPTLQKHHKGTISNDSEWSHQGNSYENEETMGSITMNKGLFRANGTFNFL